MKDLHVQMISPQKTSILLPVSQPPWGNGLASAGLLGGKTNKQISTRNPTYLSPDGQTFAIWGIIYTLELDTWIKVIKRLLSGYLN